MLHSPLFRPSSAKRMARGASTRGLWPVVCLAALLPIGLLAGLSSNAAEPAAGVQDARPAEAFRPDAAAESAQPAPDSQPTPGRFHFPDAGVTFDADFPGAKLDDCTRISHDRYQITIRPETTPINNSPWYAFQVRSEPPRSLTLWLAYEEGSHRYVPRISRDGRSWQRLDARHYRYERDQRQAILELDAEREPLWVAAQELITAADYDAWTTKLASLPHVTRSELGRSVDGRPIHQLKIGNVQASDHVLLIGRQHPPEVTGAIAMMAFVERLAGDSQLAARFRDKTLVTVVPLMNPDGVQAGFWRCNRNLVDMNRDWKRFQQPETRAVRDEALRIIDSGNRLRLMIDFHSTFRDVFYVPPAGPPRPAENGAASFSDRWLDAIQARLPDYSVRRVPTGDALATSANWGLREFRIPAITYEVGDATDRQVIRRVAVAASDEMMRLRLEESADRLPATQAVVPQ